MESETAKQLYYGGKKIPIFPDYPSVMTKQRALFNRTREHFFFTNITPFLFVVLSNRAGGTKMEVNNRPSEGVRK